MVNRNVTLNLPEDVLRRAKMVAAARDTSLSALVAEYLEELGGQIDDYDLVWAEEQRLMRDGLAMRIGTITWSRHEVHER